MNASRIRQPFGIATPLTLLLLLLLPACGGGGSTTPDPDPTPDPLTVSGVFPKDLSARVGSAVRFIAQTSAQVSSYAWDFHGGATPSTSTQSQPLVTLGPPGTYTATLTVCAADCSEAFPFSYTVKPDTNPLPDAPRILSVSPSGSAGARGTTVTFSAQLDGEADFWRWDFGGGTVAPTSSEAAPQILLLREGIFTGTVTAGLSSVGQDTFTFSYLVMPGTVQAPPIIDFISSEGISACDNRKLVFEPEVISDFPVTTYDWTFTGGVTPSISTNSIARVTTQGLDSGYTATLRVSNQFGVSAPRTFNYTVLDCPEATVEFSPRDEVAQGTWWMDVHSPSPVPAVMVAVQPHGVLVNGPWFIDDFTRTFEVSSKSTNPITGIVRLGRSDWAVGDPVPFSIPFTPPGPLPRWNSVLTIPSTTFSSWPPEVGLVDGRPAVVFIDPVREWMQYASSSVPVPDSNDDWQIHDVFPLPYKQTGNSLMLSPTNGRPLLLLENNNNLHLLMADTPTPAFAGDWTATTLQRSTDLLGGIYRIHGATRADGRVLLTGDRNVGGSPLVIQSLVPHPTAASDLRISEPWDPAYTFGQSPRRVIEWNGRWIALVQDSFDTRSIIAAAAIDNPATSTDWIVYPIDLPDPGRGFVNAELIAAGPHLHLLTERWNGSFLGVDCFRTTATPPLSASDWSSRGFLPDLQLSYQSQHFIGEIDDRLVALTTDVNGRWFLQRALTAEIDNADNWWKSLTIDAGNSTINPQNTSGMLVDGKRIYWTILDSGASPLADDFLGLQILTTTHSW